MKRKRTALLVSGGVVAAGALAWLLFFEPFAWLAPMESHSRCFLYVTPLPAPYRTEVTISSEPLGTLQTATKEAQWKQRLAFRAAGQTHFSISVFRGDHLVYRPELDVEVRPGDMLEFEGQPAESVQKPQFGPGPSHSFPALTDGVPSKLWCWFGAANASKESICITLRSEDDVAAVRNRLFWRGHKVIDVRSSPPGSQPVVRARQSKHTTVVEAILEIETWREVVAAQPEIGWVY
jgi:hypothetical protein